MKDHVNGSQLPMGLSMALAQNMDAMTKFAGMSKAQQQEIINQTHSVQSKKEMQSLVQGIVSSN